MDEKERRLVLQDDVYNRPRVCTECGGVMVFQGVGEYQCEECHHIAYDDYGKVRNYIEVHPGANTAEVEKETGVKTKTIFSMLREQRLQVTADSKSFLRCDMCKTPIRWGRLCPNCEVRYHRMVEDEQRRQRVEHMKAHMSGVSTTKQNRAEGAKRFQQ